VRNRDRRDLPGWMEPAGPGSSSGTVVPAGVAHLLKPAGAPTGATGLPPSVRQPPLDMA